MKPFRFASLFLALAFAARAATFTLETATLGDINAAFKAGALSSEKLVSLYLARIAAYDKQGPALNAIITLNPHALDEARALDAERKAKGPRSPLHGVPVILKDNYNTADLPTTAGCVFLAGSIPSTDAFITAKLRAAGAIILAKANTSEFALSGKSNGFSSLGGQTLNPHDLTRGPAGSSGGSGAALAAWFAPLAFGSDTGGSVRGPSAANGIPGLKPTLGSLSRAGIVPLALSFDTGGPMARNVSDLAVVMNFVTGVDSHDPATAASAGKLPKDFTTLLKPGALKGARFGVLRDFMGADADTDAIIEHAVATLQAQGATIVDVKLPDYVLTCREGFRRFDFGRSTRNSGTYQFKRQWGAHEEPAFWYTIPLASRRQTPDAHESAGPSHGGHAKGLVVKAWQRLPLPVTRWLGPRLRRYLTQ